MAEPVRLGRKRPLPVCPNPLFVRWLTEWRDEAASRGRHTRFVFQKLSSPLCSPGIALPPTVPATIAQREGSQDTPALRRQALPHAGRKAEAAPSIRR
uniref:MUS81 structure-specific endonuclease subunit n=1 Tax=Mus musculus TaxID=10090 RepID=D6RCJ5_MOUSE